MFILKMTSQFKKDLKRIQNNPAKIKHLKEVLQFLERNGFIPDQSIQTTPTYWQLCRFYGMPCRK